MPICLHTISVCLFAVFTLQLQKAAVWLLLPEIVLCGTLLEKGIVVGLKVI